MLFEYIILLLVTGVH